MGKITKVMYEQLPEDLCSVRQVSAYYWYQNAIGLDPSIMEESERYEHEQLEIRSKVFRKYMDEHPGTHPLTRSAIYGNSSIHNKVVLVARV